MKTSLSPLFARIAPSIVAFMLVGCATTYEMQVDAIKNPTAPKAESYILVPHDPDTNVNDLRYQEAVKWIKTALSGRGMYEAIDVESADMIIEVDYGIKPPRREFKVVNEPVMRATQDPATLHTVSVRDPRTGNISTRSVIVPGRVRNEMSGFEQRVVSVVVNEKYLELTARENVYADGTGDQPAHELWSVRVVNTDDKDDLREYLPIMASAAIDYVGEDTGEKKKIRLQEGDDGVQFVKRGIQKDAVAQGEAPATL